MNDLRRSDDLAFFATCPRNTEGLLLEELRSLGAVDATETRAGVSFHGTLSLAYRVCLWSRVASRVLLRLQSCAASSIDDLYDCARAVDWQDHLGRSGTLAVDVTSTVRRGPLAGLNTHFAEQRVKDAVVDRFRACTGERPGVDLARPDIRINVHLTPEGAAIGIDLSGDGLHRRGYRAEGGEAPLKENLAAAILMRAGWPRVAAAGGMLLDPMCGSGTLLIEGALMAADLAPGLLRDYYGFLRWKPFEPEAWRRLLEEARERREAGLRRLPPVYGFDSDARAVGTARNNARAAGLAGRVIVEQRALASLVAPQRRSGTAEPPVFASDATRGLVVTNPPYGKRLGEAAELVELYELLGERLKSGFSGWETAVFTGNPELGAHLGLRAHRVNVLFNGPIECRLLLFHIGPAAPAHGRKEEAEEEPADLAGTGAVMFENRLRKNFKHLRRWASRENIHCYRVYDADLPEYAAAVDLYEDWAHVQEYAPPSTIDPVRARRRVKEMVAAVPRVLEIPPSHVVLKVRRQQRGTDQYQKLKDQGRFFEVREDGLRLLVNLTDYLDTGLFLDHRPTRHLIRDLAQGRRFLNLFGYTGSATVYAAAGGAVSTTTIDLSLTYLDWARRNLELNGLLTSKHSFIRADCLEWLRREAAGAETATRGAGRRDAPGVGRAGAPGAARPTPGSASPRVTEYGLIFLDAPTFSNSKAMTADLDIQRDHAGLIRAAARLLTTDGILLFSTNFRHFKLEPALREEFQVEDMTRQTIPPDFARNPRIHQCFRITRRALRRQGGPHAG